MKKEANLIKFTTNANIKYISEITPPNICPNCSKPATNPIKIYSYKFDFGFLLILYRLLVRLITGPQNSEPLLNVKICNNCLYLIVFNKILEWISRFTGIFFTFYFMIILSTPDEPLIKRSFWIHMLIFYPLILGIAVAYYIQNLYKKSKGVVFIGKEGNKNWFSAKSSEWVNLFTSLNPHKDEDPIYLIINPAIQELVSVEGGEGVAISILDKCPACGADLSINDKICPDCELALR